MSPEPLRPRVPPFPHLLALKELLPGIISQAGPQQYEYLKKLQGEMKMEAPAEVKKEEKKEEDIPDLVATNFEEVSNKPEAAAKPAAESKPEAESKP